MAAMQLPELKRIDATSRATQEAISTPPAEIKTLSLADMCCLAVERGLPVLTGDKHWLTLTLPIRVFDFRDEDLHP
jgi:PIN domain nuclease of toxin-antitoxin system